MMKTNAPTILLICLLALVPLGTARAMDVLSAEDLAAACLTEETDAALAGTACMMYVRGFIDGAIATDPRVVTNVAREYEEKETFSERAARTRIGSRLDRYGPSVFAEFCIPQPVPLSEISSHVIESLRGGYEPDEPARELVYRVLREYYPCEDSPGVG